MDSGLLLLFVGLPLGWYSFYHWCNGGNVGLGKLVRLVRFLKK